MRIKVEHFIKYKKLPVRQVLEQIRTDKFSIMKKVENARKEREERRLKYEEEKGILS